MDVPAAVDAIDLAQFPSGPKNSVGIKSQPFRMIQSFGEDFKAPQWNRRPHGDPSVRGFDYGQKHLFVEHLNIYTRRLRESIINSFSFPAF